ncbi:hypothetical protein BU17DRAFT_87217 [Hysterangium stoloniferum]|nr:hypothetical protein BU17DRAFT_87217 [Hysterangium stoloniferum]
MQDSRTAHTVFSRGSTPPSSSLVAHNPSTEEGPLLPPPPQHRAETQEVTHHQPQPSAVHDIDELLRGLSNPPRPPSANSTQVHLPETSATAPATGPPESQQDKQNALLHNLINPTAYSPQAQSQPDQMQRPNASPQSVNNESGKQLLEKLFTGQVDNRQHYPIQHPYNQQQVSCSSELEHSPYTTSIQSSDALPAQQWQQMKQPSPPSPTRKSMFDFVSPFDALGPAPSQSQTGPSASKKKPVPPINPTGSSSNDESSISAEERRNRDAKRQSVENLLAEHTKSYPPMQQQEVYSSVDPYAHGQPAEPRNPLPKPAGPRKESPRSSPMTRQRPVATDSNLLSNIGPSQTQTVGLARDRDRPRDASPVLRSKRAGGPKKMSPPSPPAKSIIFDVSRELETIVAPENSVKSTAIALVKIEPVFLPGSTIGATSWIAYAMTKGRVRIISRSSGDRTLLQLPHPFPQTSSVIDMVVSGNRLAGVTSDGGFVVWELPKVIEDDVPAIVLVCVHPGQGHQGNLKSVKWHPKQPTTLAVASENRIHLVNVDEVSKVYQGDGITQMEFSKIGVSFPVPSLIVGFAFDIPNVAIATITEDSTLTLWSIRDRRPFWNHKIFGEGTPSSIDFLDGGLIIGRKNGTIFQLLSVMGREVLSTVKFVNGDREDPEMFGHVAYDSRIQTLWVANSRRESLIALRVNFESATSLPAGEEVARGGFCQIVEFTGPKASIHFVILTPDTDPNGEEAHAACVAAKLPPGELALVAFVVHSTGVDQVLIRKEWFDEALNSALDRLPPYDGTQYVMSGPQSQNAPRTQVAAPSSLQQQLRHTPPSDEVDVDAAKDDAARGNDPKNKYGKSKGGPAPEREFVKEKEKEKEKDKEKEKPSDKAKEVEKPKPLDLGPLSDSPVAISLTKEIRKVEENLHTRIGRLIGKELDKQHHRLEDIRQAEQRNEFERQQTILKLISTELTKNTTRVVESAVKTEVQQSVLPALERITKEEVKLALNSQIAKGLAESMQRALPEHITQHLLRADVSSHVVRSFSAAITPMIDMHVKDAITNVLIPNFTQVTNNMHDELSREIHSEIVSLRKEIISWQSEALHGQETLIREMEHSIRSLTEQVKMLNLNMPVNPPPQHTHHQGRVPASPPSGSGTHGHGTLPSHLRQPNYPINPPIPQAYGTQASYGPPPASQGQPYYTPTSLPGQPTPPSTAQVPNVTPGGSKTNEEWEEIFMSILGSQDLRQLRDLLSRSKAEVVLPAGGKGPLSQAVVLTLVHRLASLINDSNPGDEVYKQFLWWLTRAANSLNPSDDLISPYIARLLPNIQQTLTSARQRLILPGMPNNTETSRAIQDIQEILGRKPLPNH